MLNVTEVTFCGLQKVFIDGLYQWDYGQLLAFPGLALPSTYEVHFAQAEETCTVLGGEDGVEIPDIYLQTAETITAYIYLHQTEEDGETVYVVGIPVLARPEPSEGTPTPVEQDIITQAIAALNTAVTESSQSASDAAESADAAAQSAREAKESAESASQSAQDAQTSAESALDSANRASTSEANASRYASQAQQSATSASESAQSASTSADRAEQAAKDAGYMFFYIDENGDLIYQRTSNTQVDFYLTDGDLYVRASE